MNYFSAINIFLKQAIRENGIPFELKINQPNTETMEAISEGEKIIKEGKTRFDTADEMFADLGIWFMLKPEYTTKFKKDLKTIEKRNLDLEILKDIMRWRTITCQKQRS